MPIHAATVTDPRLTREDFFGTSNPLLLPKALPPPSTWSWVKCIVSSFPDGETFVKIEENVRGEDVFIVQSSSPPTNHHLMEMFIMMDAVRRASASRITAVLPFGDIAPRSTMRKDQAVRDTA